MKVDTSSAEYKSLMQLGATLTGAAVGTLASGDVKGASTAANAAFVGVTNNYLKHAEALALEKELKECKAKGSGCAEVVQKYIDISNMHSKEVKETCQSGLTCVGMEELVSGTTLASMPETSGYFEQALQDKDAIELVKYLNGTDLNYMQQRISTADRVIYNLLDPVALLSLAAGGRAIATGNGKTMLISAGIGAGANAAIQYGISGQVSMSDVTISAIVGAVTAGKGYGTTTTANALGGYYGAKINGNSDPNMAGMTSWAGSALGYGAANAVTSSLNKYFNPIGNHYLFPEVGPFGIMGQIKPSSIPSVAGNMWSSVTSGTISDELNRSIIKK